MLKHHNQIVDFIHSIWNKLENCIYLHLFRSLLDKEEVNMTMKCLTGSDGLAKEAFTVSILHV